MKRRIVIFVSTYPQVSETYIKNEVDALWNDYEIEIVAFAAGSYPYRTRRPHIVVTKENQHNVLEYLRAFRPHQLHAHYLVQLPQLTAIAQLLQVPFTVRAHSFDVLGGSLASGAGQKTVAGLSQAGTSPLCRGVLCFPFMRERLIAAGLPADKVIACNPVIDVLRFQDTSPNGRAVMNVGAAIPKKSMGDFVALSRMLPERDFNLYGLGYLTARLAEENRQAGGRVRFVGPVDPEDMPPEYKKHAWLVYTASKADNTVGWPMALIEAMASGVGVCMQNLRSDLRDYLGDVGFLYDTPADLVERLRVDPSAEQRVRGFAWAEQYDFRHQLPLLTNLW
jgi:glycosyltransferase involved in cell wall biosynthesis